MRPFQQPGTDGHRHSGPPDIEYDPDIDLSEIYEGWGWDPDEEDDDEV